MEIRICENIKDFDFDLLSLIIDIERLPSDGSNRKEVNAFREIVSKIIGKEPEIAKKRTLELFRFRKKDRGAAVVVDTVNSIVNFIKKNHEKFRTRLEPDEANRIIRVLKKFDIEQLTSEEKAEIAHIIEYVKDSSQENTLEGTVKNLLKAGKKIEKITDSIEDLEKEIHDIEKEIVGLDEEAACKEDHNFHQALKRLSKKKKALEKKVQKLCSFTFAEEIRTTETAREKLGLPRNPQDEETLNNVNEKLDVLQIKFAAIDQKLSKLHEKIEDILPKVLVRCREGSVVTFYETVGNVPFFQKYRENIVKERMTATTLTDDERKNHKHLLFSCDFSQYPKETIETYLDARFLGRITEKDNKTLMELYELADYLSDMEFISLLAEPIGKEFSDNEIITLFQNSNYNISNSKDAVSMQGLERILQIFNNLTDEDLFSLASHVIVEILKREDVNVQDEWKLYKKVAKWAEAQAQSTDKTVQDIVYEGKPGDRLIDLIRFENIPPKQYLKIARSGLLKDEERIKWSEFYLDPDKSSERKPREGLRQEKTSAWKSEWSDDDYSYESNLPGSYYD